MSNHPLYIGHNGYSNWAYLKGIMDEARLYNRALTATEVTALYQKGAVSQGNPVHNSLTDIAQKIIDNRIEEAVSVIPNMVGFLANHDYFKNTTIFKIGINGKIGTQLQKQIREKLPSWDLSHMAKDVALGLLVDFIINETTAAVDRATNHNKYYVGATWFLMKEMYALGDAYSTSKKGIPFPVAFLSSQSSFLIEVVYKDIKEFNILQKDFTGAKASEIRGEIIRARGLDLLQFYQEYFRAETQEEKAIILNDIATRQKELLSAYFSGDNIFLPRVSKIAKTVYADWLKHLPGKLVKEEFAGRVRLHTLVYYQSDYDTAIKATTFIYGTPIVAIDLIREKAQTDEGSNNYLIEHGY